MAVRSPELNDARSEVEWFVHSRLPWKSRDYEANLDPFSITG
jgi:hypothetical protein